MIDKAVQETRKNEKWRLSYMTLQMKYSEMRKQGRLEERRMIAFNLYATNKLSAEEAADLMKISEEKFLDVQGV